MLGGNPVSLLYGDVSVMRGVEGGGGSGGCKPRIEGIVKWGGVGIQSGGSECMCK